MWLGHTFPQQNPVSGGLDTWPCRQSLWLAKLFLTCALLRSQTTLAPLLSLIPPSPSCVCISISFHCLFTPSPTSALQQSEGKCASRADVRRVFFVAPRVLSLLLERFSFPGFDCPGCVRTKTCTLLLCSPDVMKSVTVESPQYDGGKYRNTFLRIKITWSI